MTLLINSYSFVAAGILVLIIVALLVERFFCLKWTVTAVTVTFVSIVVFQLMASTKTNTWSSPEDFNNALISGRPVLVELYSNF